MDAVILAAGRGSRLKPLTDTTHKTLLSVGDESILEHQLTSFDAAGIDTVHLVTGYRHADVLSAAETIADPLSLSLNSIRSTEWETTDNLYSLSLAESKVRETSFILSNADVFADKELVVEVCRQNQRIVPYDPTMFHPEELKLKLDEDGSPVGILDKGEENGAGATIGMFTFDSAASTTLFDDINTHIDVDGEKTQWFEASLDRLFPDTEFKAVDVSQWDWLEIDTVDDLRKAWDTWAGREPDDYISSVQPDT